MLRFWLDRGVDGFRADSVTVVGKAPGLPDHELHQSAGRSEREPEPALRLPARRPCGVAPLAPRGRRLRGGASRAAGGAGGRGLHTTASRLDESYANEEFHQSFAFDLLLAPWNAEAYRGATNATVEALMPAGLLPAGRSTTTTPSVRSPGSGGPTPRSTAPRSRACWTAPRCGRHRHRHAAGSCGGPVRARAAGMRVPLCRRGARPPRVLDLPDEARQDPVFVRSGGAELERDGCRVPLPWTDDASTSFGFSPRGTSDPWLPQPSEWARWSAAGQEADPTRCSRSTVKRSRSGGRRLTDVSRLRDAAPGRSGPGGVPAWRDRRRAQHVGPRSAVPDRLINGLRVLLASARDHRPPDTVGPDSAVWFGP